MLVGVCTSKVITMYKPFRVSHTHNHLEEGQPHPYVGASLAT